MIAHVTIGAEHLLVRNPTPGAAWRSLHDSTSCPTCASDLASRGSITRPRRDARAGLRLVCGGCRQSWPIVEGDPLEIER